MNGIAAPGINSATKAWPSSWWATTLHSCGFKSLLFFSSPATMRSIWVKSTVAIKPALGRHGAAFACLFEQGRAPKRRPDADEHLDEFGSAD